MDTKVQQSKIKYEGKAIILPVGMNLRKAIEQLERQIEYEEQKVEICEVIKGFVWDSAIAFHKAMKQIYGWVNAEATQSFFGKNPPQMLSLEIGVDETTLVPWGAFSLPNVEGQIQTSARRNRQGQQELCITAVVRRRHEAEIKAIAELTREILKSESIYRGKAVKLNFTDRGEIEMPSFLSLNGIDERNLVYSVDVEKVIYTNLFTPIEYAKECRELKIPLKRGILLSGKYGTGKTLAAYVTAKKAVDNGWTFILCPNVENFAQVVEFARAYMPAVIFCEDIDRLVTGERTVQMDDLLNTIDGIESKKSEIVIVLTTNHVEKINPAMLRPGRLDAVINVLPPDALACERLVKLYAGNLLDPDADLTMIGRKLEGNIPAVIRECVERAKLSALKLNGGMGRAWHDEVNPLQITSEALEDAATGMQNQLELLKPKEEETSAEEALGLSVAKVVKASLADERGSLVEEVREALS